jgi:hypothetical protein
LIYYSQRVSQVFNLISSEAKFSSMTLVHPFRAPASES